MRLCHLYFHLILDLVRHSVWPQRILKLKDTPWLSRHNLVAVVQRLPDGLQLFFLDGRRASAPPAPSFRRRQAGPDAFLGEGSLTLLANPLPRRDQRRKVGDVGFRGLGMGFRQADIARPPSIKGPSPCDSVLSMPARVA
jgi:hypothetical protein